jgi:hypothetical protein
VYPANPSMNSYVSVGALAQRWRFGLRDFSATPQNSG